MVSSIPFAALRSSSPVSSQGETSVFTAPTQDVPALPLALAREYAPASGIYDNHGSVSPNDAETCLFRLTPLVVHRGRSLSDPSALFSADDDSGLNTPLANQTCFPMSVSSQAELTTAIPESRGRALSESYLPNRPNDFESACKENMSMDTSMSANDSIGPPTPSESWPMLEGFAPRPSSCAPDTGYVFSDSLNILEGMSLPLSSSGCISGRLDCQLDGTASFASGVGLEGKENLHRRSRDLELLDA
ncbi:hypothetical protein PLICRDRAFT_35292 [Plicaturopsis crispa FD-325 SS-3]|nr:hypothetical protein PLICRDRAFT_35292 [Plicaturopsis crispa FD-325 SS-3]